MTFKEFKKRVETVYEGYTPRFERNEAQYAAHLGDNMLCMSGPHSEWIKCYWHGRFVGIV